LLPVFERKEQTTKRSQQEKKKGQSGNICKRNIVEEARGGEGGEEGGEIQFFI